MYGFWMFFIGMVVGGLAVAVIAEVWSMLIDDREDERAAAAARLSLLRRIPPEVYEELADTYRDGVITHYDSRSLYPHVMILPQVMEGGKDVLR